MRVSFFKNIFSRKQREIEKSNEELSIESDKSCFELSDNCYPSFSYEAIVSGKVDLNQLDLERVEVRRNM